MENNIKRNIKPFNGERYNVWKFRVRALLKELNVLHVVDGDEPGAENDEWNNDDSIAKNTIIEYLHDNQLSVADIDNTAKNIFKKLDELYERKSIATQLAVRKQLLALKLKGDQSLIQHFVKYDSLISELVSAGGKMEEADKISHLLLTLPNTYDSVITAIETLLEDNMTLSFVKVRLLDHEVKLKAECSETSAKVLQTYKPKGIIHNNKYKKNNNIRKHFNNKNMMKCYFCGKKGHIKKECYNYINKLKRSESASAQKASAASEKETNDAYVFMMRSDQECDHELEFVLDSGASHHIINKKEYFKRCESIEKPIRIQTAKSGSFVYAKIRGEMIIFTTTGLEVRINDVLFCPEVPNNLLSVGKLQQAGFEIKFNKNGASIIKDNVTVAQGKYENNLYLIEFSIHDKQVKLYCANNSTSFKTWHERLGHIGKHKLYEIVNNKLAKDSQLLANAKHENKLCEACVSGKQARLPFNKSKDKEYIKRPLYVIHSDVCGPITPPSVDNKNYFVTFVDEFTHYTVIYLLTYKSDVFNSFKDYVKKSQAHFNMKIVNLYCDNGGEYLSTEMKEYCVSEGISYHLTIPRTPQLNGVSERMNRTITEKARTMLIGAKITKAFWSEAVVTAVYLINISPTRALKMNKTPYEMWHGKKPEMRFLRIFGSTVYVHNKVAKTKFEEKSWKGILTGYVPNGYRVWDPVGKKFVSVRDVIIDEIDYMNTRPKLESDDESENYNQPKRLRMNDGQMPLTQNTESIDKQESETLNCQDKSPILRRSKRIKEMTQVCALNVVNDLPQNYFDLNSRSDGHKWHEAVQDEINSLLENETWEIVKCPKDKNIVDCKWVFALKNDELGNPVRYKARLVAKGFSQEYPNDYDETFAPVARMTSFRIICAFANQHNLLLHQMDVKTAFLNGILKEEIFMRIPEGVVAEANEVIKLKKALYGLKQAARCWFELFEQVLLEKGFQSFSADRCVYILDNGEVSRNVYVVLYVDDIVIATANESTMKNFKAFLMQKFKMVDMKDLRYFLGIRIQRIENKICLDQITYIKKVLEKFNMSDCNPVNTPLDAKINYQALNKEENTNYPCRNLVGSLMYIMLCTRPDLSAAVGILSRYSNKQNKELWIGLKRILRYLKGSINLTLTYERKFDQKLICGFADSDWGSDDSDRKSTSGYLFLMYENCSISWNTKKQTSVAASSTEAEYMALFEATREAKWLKSFVDDLGEKDENPIVIYEDNNGCISIANNPTSHKRSKHIDIKYHFTREQVENKLIKLLYISTENQAADAMTKPLPLVKFVVHRQTMGLK